jgi:hypothetical protein
VLGDPGGCVGKAVHQHDGWLLADRARQHRCRASKTAQRLPAIAGSVAVLTRVASISGSARPRGGRQGRRRCARGSSRRSSQLGEGRSPSARRAGMSSSASGGRWRSTSSTAPSLATSWKSPTNRGVPTGGAPATVRCENPAHSTSEMLRRNTGSNTRATDARGRDPAPRPPWPGPRPR